nr:hypothetical protein [Tanacetum cinerariifolium]
TGVKPGVPDVIKEESSKSEVESWGMMKMTASDQEENKEEIGDDKEEEEEDEFVRTPSNDFDDETKMSDKAEGNEDEEMDYTTSQLYDDVDIRLNKPVQADDETSKEPEFEVADSDIPQDQEENPGNDDEEPKRKVASKRDWFTKPKRPQEPTDPEWNDEKTPQQGPTQSWLMTLTSSIDK